MHKGIASVPRLRQEAKPSRQAAWELPAAKFRLQELGNGTSLQFTPEQVGEYYVAAQTPYTIRNHAKLLVHTTINGSVPCGETELPDLLAWEPLVPWRPYTCDWITVPTGIGEFDLNATFYLPDTSIRDACHELQATWNGGTSEANLTSTGTPARYNIFEYYHDGEIKLRIRPGSDPGESAPYEIRLEYGHDKWIPHLSRQYCSPAE